MHAILILDHLSLILLHIGQATRCDDDDSFDEVSENEADSEPEEPPKPRWHPPRLVPICLVLSPLRDSRGRLIQWKWQSIS